MFSSLDRADIVLKAGPDGRQRFIQTDHRSPHEVEAERELSTVFALVRVMNPKRLVEPGMAAPVVIYSSLERPPEFLRQAIRAAGGHLVIGDDLQPDEDEGPTPPLDELIQSAFAELAQMVATEYDVPLTLDGLKALESTLAESAGDPETDEYAYWSAVVKLGSFAGEVIRQTNGGHWNVGDMGKLPFVLAVHFQGEVGMANPLGKASERFDNGEEDSLVLFVRVLCSRRRGCADRIVIIPFTPSAPRWLLPRHRAEVSGIWQRRPL